MEEIFISQPPLNTDVRRDDLVYATKVQQGIFSEMNRVGITPSQYPRAVDLAAGNGSMAAKVLIPRG